MKNTIFKILTLNPEFYQKSMPKNGKSIYSKLKYHFFSFVNQVFLSWEVPYSISLNGTFWHHVGVVINDNVKIGEKTIIRQNTTLGINHATKKSPKLGRMCELGANCNIIGGVIIEDNVKIGAGCNIAESVIQNGTKIGMGCTITYSNIGENCKIRSGAVLHGVTVPDNSVVMPAKSEIIMVT